VDYPPATERVIKAAAERGSTIEPVVFAEGTKTSADAAAQVGCELSAIAKSIVFMVDGQAVVVILSGDRRVDTGKLAQLLGAGDVGRASLEEARRATGFAAGGTPAFGYPHPLTVLIDEGLQRHDEVWSAAGTPTTVYPIALAELVAISGGTFADLAV
jgi:prolyl-tRNA editing enzyme YbaK/EbsC (Cys-tRNA(Pro) deacylase)